MEYPIEKFGYTIVEAGRAIGIGRTKIYEEIKAGRLKIIKVGSRSIIINLREYIAAKMREAGHATAT